jgi:hypothetical protein
VEGGGGHRGGGKRVLAGALNLSQKKKGATTEKLGEKTLIDAGKTGNQVRGPEEGVMKERSRKFGAYRFSGNLRDRN